MSCEYSSSSYEWRSRQSRSMLDSPLLMVSRITEGYFGP